MAAVEAARNLCCSLSRIGLLSGNKFSNQSSTAGPCSFLLSGWNGNESDNGRPRGEASQESA